MSHRVCVIDLPGLGHELLSSIPNGSALGRWLGQQRVAKLTPTWPAVTCSVQASLTTGVDPASHGIIANGIATFRSPADQAVVDRSNFAEYRSQVSFWEQSNQLLEARRFWQDESGRSRYKTALLFFQNSMPGFSGTLKPAADIVLTPKPEHGPDGKITSLLWASPADLVPALFRQLGPFPLMNYWGPMAGIESSRWIAKAATAIWNEHQPQLQWVYVPHLDYDLQRFGPASPQAHKAVADVAGALDPLIDAVIAANGKLVVLSEYAMVMVDRAVYPNRILAQAGLLRTQATPDGTLVDYQTSDAFAMVDHQIAHVYCRDAAATKRAAEALRTHRDIRTIYMQNDRSRLGVEHRRSGDLLLQAVDTAWFAYPWWMEESAAPAFARTVDIHRKPGYDPLELFWDRSINGTSQDPALVKGSHGAVRPGEAVLAGDIGVLASEGYRATEVPCLLEQLLG